VHWTFQFAIGLGMVAISIGMMWFEYVRNRAGRPVLKSEAVAIPYWLLYLTLLLLGSVAIIAAFVR
jgi:hypothetical protein